MSQPPPIPPRAPIPVQPLPPQQRGVGIAGRFVMGLIVGSVISGLVWPTLFVTNANLDLSGYLIFGIPLAKVTAAACIIAVPRMRGFGIGLLASIPVGFLIFFGVCASVASK